MYKQKQALLLLLFLFSAYSKLQAQIVVTPSLGCLPLGITNAVFDYTGPGTPSNVLWNFGDGTATSSLLPTQHSYPAAGSYTVTFSATIGGVSVTYTSVVSVNPVPTGNFSFNIPANHCAPLTASFNATSTGSNQVYTWAFGDLTGGSGSSLTHVYNSAGSFTPILTVQNTLTGCFFNVAGNAIPVSFPPSLQIVASPGTSTCAPSFTTAFDVGNSSSNSPISGGGLTYVWNYAPFGTSTSPNTGNVVFSPVGVYVVTLTATDNNSCSSSTTTVVSLLSPTVTAVVPPTVCIAPQTPLVPYSHFTVTVNSNQPTSQWYMGDGSVITFPIPTPPNTPVLLPNTPYTSTIHVYTTPGIKQLTVTVSDGVCSDTAYPTIFVEEITPAFSAVAPSFTCSPTFTTGYINQTTLNSNSALSYVWNVNTWSGDTTVHVSTSVNPTFTLTQSSSNPYVNYYHPPYYVTATLKIKSQPAGCLADITQMLDTIHRPTAMFEVLQAEGCAPLPVTFYNTSIPSISGTYVYPILSYTWNFGASPTSTLAATAAPGQTTIPNAFYTYTNPGTYYPTLSITTASGCGHTSYQHTITVADPPSFSYTLSPSSTVCAVQQVTVQFASTAPDTAITHWHVGSDLGYFSGCVNEDTHVWKFTHPGVHDFTLSAYQYGCKFDSVIPAAVTVKGPIGKMLFTTNCAGNRKEVRFNYKLMDATNAVLDYGDGVTSNIIGVADSSVTGSTTHIYPASGDYTATLTSYNTANSCGAVVFSVIVTVRELNADFTFEEDVICKGGYPTVTALSAVDVYTTCGRGYTWYFDNYAPHQTPSFTHTSTQDYSTVGMHTVKLLVKDVNGCLDSVRKSFRVSAPAPTFTFNSNPVCFSGMPFQMINLTPQAPDSVYNYYWTVGDSVLYTPHLTVNSGITGTTSAHSPTFAYPNVGGAQTQTFLIVLNAENVIGCKASTHHILTVNDPVINVIRDDYKGCTPGALRVFSIQTGSTHMSYSIDFGDSPPITISSFSANATHTLSHNFLTPGTYTPVFTLTDFAGCVKTYSFNQPPMIIQTKPVPGFFFFNVIDNLPGPGPAFCAPFSPSVISTTQSPFDLSYTWNLGIGGAQTILDSTAFTNYPDMPGQYTISLNVYTRPAGCASYTQNVINIFNPKIKFRLDPDSLKTTYCLGEPISLLVTSHPGVEYYRWNFGDGVVTPSVYPVPSIPSTLRTDYGNTFYPDFSNGVLTLELTAYAGLGNKICKDVVRKEINLIRVKPDFNRNNELVALDSIHCLGEQEFFKNLSTTNSLSSDLTYTWTLGDGTTNSSTDVSHVYASPGIYTVTLQATEPVYNCKDSISKKMVIFPNPTASISVTPFSCPNEPFIISGSGSPGVSGSLTFTVLPQPEGSLLDSLNAFNITTTASVSTSYSVKVTDSNGCVATSPSASVYIQPPAKRVDWDTTVIIGETIPLNAYAGAGFSYTWAPEVSYLNCDTCMLYNPISSAPLNITYSVMVEDSMNCSVVTNTYRIYIDVKASLDVPTAFTPNGDGINDIIYPDGWGLKKLNYFKVFNRWGQLVFESNSLSVGWDGNFNGVPQNMETYVYQASADTQDPKNPVLFKTGTFKLIR